MFVECAILRLEGGLFLQIIMQQQQQIAALQHIVGEHVPQTTVRLPSNSFPSQYVFVALNVILEELTQSASNGLTCLTILM